MKAWRVRQYGNYQDALTFEDCESPTLRAGQHVIKVDAAALNFPDFLAISGTYQIRAPLPFTPGLEAVGRLVRAVGDRAAGQRVMVSAAWGAFAELMAVPESMIFDVAPSMSDAEAAAFLVSYQTSYFALKYRAQLQPGETLLVHGGAGGVGTSAIQLGKAMGAQVIAVAGSAEKLKICAECGADELINHREVDFVAEVKRLTAGRGADVIYDPVGGDVFDKSTRCIAFSGRLLVIGFAAGRIATIKTNRILLKNIAIVGLHWGFYQEHDPQLMQAAQRELIALYEEGRLKPVIYRSCKMEDLVSGLDELRSRRSYGKIVVIP